VCGLDGKPFHLPWKALESWKGAFQGFMAPHEAPALGWPPR
jgi:hypothetical protein